MNETPSWCVFGSAVAGAQHLRQGRPCQDVVGYGVTPEGTLLIALADGAGTAVYADKGARFAVDAALEYISHELAENEPQEPPEWEILLMGAFESARKSIEELACDEEEEICAYATTLTCVIVTKAHLAAAQVGDGAVVVGDSEGKLVLAVTPQRGEYANETVFLTQQGAVETVQIQVLEQPIHKIAVMSDGLARLALKMPALEPHAPFFEPLFTFALKIGDLSTGEDRLEEFLSSERVNTRTDDDKALVVAVQEDLQEAEAVFKGEEELQEG